MRFCVQNISTDRFQKQMPSEFSNSTNREHIWFAIHLSLDIIPHLSFSKRITSDIYVWVQVVKWYVKTFRCLLPKWAPNTIFGLPVPILNMQTLSKTLTTNFNLNHVILPMSIFSSLTRTNYLSCKTAIPLPQPAFSLWHLLLSVQFCMRNNLFYYFETDYHKIIFFFLNEIKME